MFVIKCKTDDEFKYLDRQGNLVALCIAEKYSTHLEATTEMRDNSLQDVAKVRRFIAAKKPHPYQRLIDQGLTVVMDNDEIPFVTWDSIDKHPRSMEIREFMNGQTHVKGGAYPWDIERFFRQ